MTTATKTLILTKTTPNGKKAEIFAVGNRFDVVLDGVSGGLTDAPFMFVHQGQRLMVINHAKKLVLLTDEEVEAITGKPSPLTHTSKATPDPRCRVCGGKVDYSEQYATRGYCGCQGE